ncbi:jg22974 [Pararge aegeria aegeria]|uniref:Jg22974 protein n=1 Tax=Pararge aegeria aegeria TaxID=348720 RepID=A0A8S4QVX4_9NEOP|nr:jg22974 [Pararge aegeria aegeria]
MSSGRRAARKHCDPSAAASDRAGHCAARCHILAKVLGKYVLTYLGTYPNFWIGSKRRVVQGGAHVTRGGSARAALCARYLRRRANSALGIRAKVTACAAGAEGQHLNVKEFV